MAEKANIKRVPKKVKTETLEKDLKELCKIVHSEWKDEEIHYEKLSGGLLNEIYKCQSHNKPEGALVVRVYTSQDVCDLVDRSKEIIGMQVGCKAGVSEPLRVIFDNGLVYGFAPGKTVNWGLLWDDHVARKYMSSLAKFHMTDPAKIVVLDHLGNPTSSLDKSKTLGLFDKLKNVIKDIPEEFKHFPERADEMKGMWSKARFLEEIELLEKHFSKFQMNVTFSHNDVWVNNVVYDRETDRLSLLDFEYCDFNFEMFDVAILFNCFQLFELYREVFPRNIMIPTDDELKLPRTAEHRKKLVKFYMEERCLYLGEEPGDYTDLEFSNFHTHAEMLSTVVNMYWTIFGLAQSDDPTVTWNLFKASERSFNLYCAQRERLFQYQPC